MFTQASINRLEQPKGPKLLDKATFFLLIDSNIESAAMIKTSRLTTLTLEAQTQ